jgi:glutamate synthase domain-containing protein 3
LETPRIEEVRQMIERHARHTRSQRAFGRSWRCGDSMLPKFVKVMPKDYKRMLDGIARVREGGVTGDEAVMRRSRRMRGMSRGLAAVDRYG